MENNKKIKPITVRFDEGDFNRLTIDSKEKGMNISELIRSLVRDRYKAPDPLPEQPSKPDGLFTLKVMLRNLFKLDSVKQK